MKVGVVGEIHPSGYEIFDKNNIEYFVTNNIDEGHLIEKLRDVDGIVVRTAEINKNILSQSKNLKIVARHGVGYDNVDTEYLNHNKIAMAITGKANATSVAEHVMTMMLCLTKNIFESDRLVKLGKFQEKGNLPNYFELYNKKILILGFGRIGKALAKRCNGFEMEVYVHDPFLSDEEIKNHKCIPINKEEGFKIADYISIHLPLNEETKNLISFDQFETFKSNMILINTARGGIINEIDLNKALNENIIFGAGLDVFEREPIDENNPLKKNKKVLLSPHSATFTNECKSRMSIETTKNIIDFFENKIDKSMIVKL